MFEEQEFSFYGILDDFVASTIAAKMVKFVAPDAKIRQEWRTEKNAWGDQIEVLYLIVEKKK